MSVPQFFFHTADGKRDRDKHGVDLPDAARARVEGIKYAGAVIADQPGLLWNGHDFRVEVTDESGALLFTIITLAVDAPAAENKR